MVWHPFKRATVVKDLNQFIEKLAGSGSYGRYKNHGHLPNCNLTGNLFNALYEHLKSTLCCSISLPTQPSMFYESIVKDL